MARRQQSKVAVAFFMAAVVIAGQGLLTRGGEEPRSPAPPRASALVEPVAARKSTEELIALWQGRVEEDPRDSFSRTQLAHAVMTQARETGNLSLYDQAERLFEAALDVNERDPQAILGLGSARAARHDFVGQLALAEQVLAVEPDSLAALAAVGDARFELGDYLEAAAIYDDLVAQERSAPVLIRRARLAAIHGRTAEALALAGEAATEAAALDLPPQTAAQYQFHLGHHRYEAGDINGAAAALEQALEVYPAHLGARELLAQVRVAQRRLHDAIAIYEGLIDAGPAADLHGSVAALYDAVGEHRIAAGHIEFGLELGRSVIGQYPAERRHLAQFFARHDPALALLLAQEDLATRHDVAAYDTLAWALYQNGRIVEALDASRRARAEGTRSAYLLYHAGMIEAAAGNHADARMLLSEALAINPHFDVIDAPVAAETLAGLPGAAGVARGGSIRR